MPPQARSVRSVIALCACAVLLTQVASGARVRPPAAASVTQEVAGVQARPDLDPATRRARFVAIDFDALPALGTPGRAPLTGRTIALDLFDGVTVTAVFDRFDSNAHGITWVGRVEGAEGSSVTLVYGGGALAGSIVVPSGIYSIRPASDAVRRANPQPVGELHVISDVDQSAFPPEAPPIPVEISAADQAAAAEAQPTDTAEFIDVMVVYTAAAEVWSGGTPAMLNLINLGISETNTSYATSGVKQRLRLAHAVELPYVETTNFSTSLNDLRQGLNGLQTVGALRDQYSADMVTMLVRAPGGSACGIGYLMSTVSTAFAPFAMSVTDASCVSPNYTFAHELGHNMGLQHDWYVAPSTVPYTYAHGHVNPAAGQRWRTIMSYNDRCSVQGFSCSRLLRWANPELTFNGAPTGIQPRTSAACPGGAVNNSDCDADDRRALNNTALTVANFRQLVQPGAPAPFGKISPVNNAVDQPSSVTLQWQASPGAFGYEYCYDVADDNDCVFWLSAGTSLSAVVFLGTETGTTYYWQVRAVNGMGPREANGGTWWSVSTPGNAVYDPAFKAPRCGAIGSYCDSGTLLRGRASITGRPEANHPNTIGNSCSDGTLGAFHVDESIDKIRVTTVDGGPLAIGKTVVVEVNVWVFSLADSLDIYAARDAASPIWAHVVTVSPPSVGQKSLSVEYTLPVGGTQAVRAAFRYGSPGSTPPPPCFPNSGYDDRDDLVFAVEAPEDTNLITNGTFDAGLSSWSVFSLPTPGDLVAEVTGGTFRFFRPVGSTQGVVLQPTGVPAAASVPLFATFDLGNTTPVRQRVSVLIHDGDFLDLHVCTFWIAPDTPPAVYSMRTRTTKPWANITMSIYAATEGNGGAGFALLDNVTLVLAAPNPTPGLDHRTECGDPAAPSAGGAAGGALVSNGSFDGGTIAPWTTFGEIAFQLTAGVFEFFKIDAPPAGVLLQATGEPVAMDQPVHLTFHLGNSSAVRQRVTVLLHKEDFQDLHACTFWVPAGQPVSPYAMRTYATAGWSNATVSVYPATAGPAPWLRLDEVGLTRVVAPVAGTECQEPGMLAAAAAGGRE